MYSQKMCYTCLKSENKELVDLYKNDIDKIPYIDKLTYCLSAKLQIIPIMEMCWSCIKQLRISYQFIDNVRNTQVSLKMYSNTSQPSNTNEEQKYVKNESNEMYVNNMEVQQSRESCVNKCDIEDISTYSKNVLVKSELSSINYNSDSSDYFLADLKNDTTDFSNTYTCKMCNKVYLNSATFTEHVCETNEDVNVLKTESVSDISVGTIKSNCKENKEEKMTKKVRNRPSKYTKKPKPEVSYPCDYCDLTFNKRWKVQKHSARVHVQEKKYVCTYCNSAFKQSYHLREHLTSHTGERNYSCTFCDKTFQRISSQRRHIRSHEAAPGQKTKRTPFLCTICGKSFPFSNGVQRHMRIHLGIKTHECHLCKRKFTQSTHLHVHMRTHTGEKPYICDTCGEAFSLNAGLQKHMTVHQSVSKNNFVDDLTRAFLVPGTR